MEIEGIHLIYAFIVSWNDISRGVFLSEFFTSLETCTAHLQSWIYDAELVNLKCVQIKPT